VCVLQRRLLRCAVLNGQCSGAWHLSSRSSPPPNPSLTRRLQSALAGERQSAATLQERLNIQYFKARCSLRLDCALTACCCCCCCCCAYFAAPVQRDHSANTHTHTTHTRAHTACWWTCWWSNCWRGGSSRRRRLWLWVPMEGLRCSE